MSAGGGGGILSGGARQLLKDNAQKRAEALAEALANKREATAETARVAKDAETAKIEGERMSVGSKSRTLLTSPSGLSEDDSISKRSLSGF